MIVTHPTWPDVTKEVDDEHVDEWLAAGWLPPLAKGGALPKGKPAVNVTRIPEQIITSPKTPRSATTR